MVYNQGVVNFSAIGLLILTEFGLRDLQGSKPGFGKAFHAVALFCSTLQNRLLILGVTDATSTKGQKTKLRFVDLVFFFFIQKTKVGRFNFSM